MKTSATYRSYLYVPAHKAQVVDKAYASEADAIVLGAVDLGPPRDGTQSIAVDWRVIEPSGDEIGTISQANSIPAGALDGPWGDIAFAIASGAAEGILTLLDRLAATPQ